MLLASGTRKYVKQIEIIQQAVRKTIVDDGTDVVKAELSDQRFQQLSASLNFGGPDGMSAGSNSAGNITGTASAKAKSAAPTPPAPAVPQILTPEQVSGVSGAQVPLPFPAVPGPPTEIAVTKAKSKAKAAGKAQGKAGAGKQRGRHHHLTIATIITLSSAPSSSPSSLHLDSHPYHNYHPRHHL